jgi:DNA-3-methyladenine glycosylase
VPVGTVDLAQALIGKLLVRRLPDGALLAGRIVETEAYEVGDPSSHAFRGQTVRNATMFARHMHAYVYLIYGMYHCLNISTELPGEGAAILIRAVEPLAGIERMIELRGARDARSIARGPGRLCAAFAIDRDLDGIDLDVDDRLWLADDGHPAADIGTSIRIGLSKAVERPHRFYVRGNPHVSGPRALSP